MTSNYKEQQTRPTEGYTGVRLPTTLVSLAAIKRVNLPGLKLEMSIPALNTSIQSEAPGHSFRVPKKVVTFIWTFQTEFRGLVEQSRLSKVWVTKIKMLLVNGKKRCIDSTGKSRKGTLTATYGAVSLAKATFWTGKGSFGDNSEELLSELTEPNLKVSQS